MKYRSRTEILGQILRCVSSGGCTKTKIMYKAYLSYAQIKEYLKFADEKDLIKYEEGTQLYKVTERGIEFMRKYDEVREIISDNKFLMDEPEQPAAPRMYI